MDRLLVIARPWDRSAEALTAIYLADGDYTSAPADTPANTIFQARMIEGYDFEARLWSGDEPGGDIVAGDIGRVRVANADGALDGALDHGWDGRAIEFYTVADGAAFSTATLRVTATIERIAWSEAAFDLILRSARARLERDIVRAFYGGAGELDGSAELAGLPKPFLAGAKDQVPAVLIDPVNLIYQVHDSAMQAIGAVRDQGVALTFQADVAIADLVATSVTAGQYKTALDGGCFKLGSSPNGLVTCDAEGDDLGGAYVENAADLVERIACKRLGRFNFAAGDLDSTAFSDLATDQPATLGEWIGTTPVRADDLIAAIMGTIGGTAYFTRLEKLSVWRLVDPAGESATATIEAAQISGLRPLHQASRTMPSWRRRVAYRTLGRVQVPDELAASVSEADQVEWGTARRFAKAEPETPVSTTSVHGEESLPEGLAFKSDGTKVYIVGFNQDTVYQYPLSTAWDISTAGSFEASLVLTGLSLPRALAFKTDGTKLYVLDWNTNNIRQFPLSTAWDVSSAGAYENSRSVPAGDPRSLAFKTDGLKLYVLDGIFATITQQTLSFAWTVSSAGTVEATFSTAGRETTPSGFAWKSDGTKLYVIGLVTGEIHQYGVGTAWSLSGTITHETSFSIPAKPNTPVELAFSADGTKLFVLEKSGDGNIYEYEMETAWDIDTIINVVQSAHRFARDVESRGLFHEAGDPDSSPVVYGAQDEAERLAALWDDPPEVYEIAVTDAVFVYSLGQIVELKIARFGLDAGANFVVKGLAENRRRGETVLELWRTRA